MTGRLIEGDKLHFVNYNCRIHVDSSSEHHFTNVVILLVHRNSDRTVSQFKVTLHIVASNNYPTVIILTEAVIIYVLFDFSVYNCITE